MAESSSNQDQDLVLSLKSWRGTFQSEYYGWVIVYGDVSTKLSDDPQATYTTSVEMYYKGVYMLGSTVTDTIEVTPGQMTITRPGQTVSFKVTTRTQNKITGTYTSFGRYDHGKFELTRD